MTVFNSLIIGLIATALSLALIGIWSARTGAARLVMVGLFALLIGLFFSGSASLLGRAKPVAFAWFDHNAREATVLNGHLLEDRGIYLTLTWEDTEPQLYVLPWDQELAQQLQDAMAKAEQNGTRTKMRLPINQTTLKEEPVFHAMPQPRLPEKQVPKQGMRLG